MAELDRRVRALGWFVGRNGIDELDGAALRAAQSRRVPRNVFTNALLGGMSKHATSTDFVTDGPGGGVAVRVYRPRVTAGLLPLVVHFHGGGWVLGNLDLGDWLCSNVAVGSEAVVVSVDYRLAPDHRFPAGLDDCYSALVWASDHSGRIGADGSRIAVMGDSAGGNLAAVICQVAKERSGPVIAHQSLIYPATDLTLGSESLHTNAEKPILTTAQVEVFRDLYLPDVASRRDPRASPLLRADLGGLPPALIQVAEHDPIRDDGRRYADALGAAGVAVRHTEYAGMPHGFLSFPNLCRRAPEALSEICREQTAALVPASESVTVG